MNKKLALFDAIADPIKTHVHGLGSALLDGAVGDASGACIISLNGRGRLGVTHVG